MHAASKEFGRRPSTYFKAAITAPIAPLQTLVQKAHLKAIVNRCQKILFLFICCLVVYICFLYSFIFGFASRSAIASKGDELRCDRTYYFMPWFDCGVFALALAYNIGRWPHLLI